MKLKLGAFALAGGIFWVLTLVGLSLLALYLDYGTPFVDLIGSIYLGYELTVAGIAIGALWAFFDGLIACVIFGGLYNLLVRNGN